MRIKYIAPLLLAISLFASPVFADSGTNEQWNRAVAAYNNGDYEAAAKDFYSYALRHRNNENAWSSLANSYLGAGQLEKAKIYFEKTIEINDKTPDAYTGLGIIARKQEDYAAAETYYNKALKADPNYAQAYTSLVVIALKQSRDIQAVMYGEKGYELLPSDPIAAANLAMAYHYADEIQKRDEMAQVASDLGYHNMDTLFKVFSGEMTIR
ncbi:MAG: tetratricopeptide repeat protein [Pontibacterium sp.]